MNYYLDAWKKFAVFGGRSTRKEYWMFVLFNFIVGMVAGLADAILGTDTLVVTIYSLAVFLPSLAILVRRLHDIGKSGLWALVGLIPFIGGLILIIFCIKGSQPEDNQYGPYNKLMTY